MIGKHGLIGRSDYLSIRSCIKSFATGGHGRDSRAFKDLNMSGFLPTQESNVLNKYFPSVDMSMCVYVYVNVYVLCV